jgi:hypothetical protein
MRNLIFCVTLATATLILAAGCGSDSSPPSPPDVPEAPVAGVYRGEFPCRNCPAIETTLWLRADGTFFNRHRYLADAGEAPVVAYNLGRWYPEAAGARIIADGRGPDRTYRRTGADQLELVTDSDLEHRLHRDPGAGPFSDVMRVAGVARVASNGAHFRECRSGLEAAIAEAADFRRFLRQYRAAAAGEDAWVEFDGRFTWAPDGSPATVTIERFVSVGEAQRCPPNT